MPYFMDNCSPFETTPLEMDERSGLDDALDIVDTVHAYVTACPGCTAYEISNTLSVPNTSLRLALHRLVRNGDIQGWDPYDSEAPGNMGALVYRT